MSSIVRYKGCNFLRQRLVLATLSSRSVSITNIREDDENPGLKEYEAGLIRLFDKLTDGSKVEVNETGTSLFYQPGLLVGGSIEHACSMQRSIGYYLEPIILLAPFMKRPARITLRGITNGKEDPSVDHFRLCVLPMLRKIVPGSDNLELKICQRGLSPDGVGEVFFSCSTVKVLKPIVQEDPGRVCRVRGLAYCVGVNPAMAGRMVDSARGVLNAYLPDVYIYTDVSRNRQQAKSPGYGITIVAETTTGVMYSMEASSLDSGKAVLPEEVGAKAATSLVEVILKGGCFDTTCEVFPILFMALGEKNVSKIKIGELSPYSTQFLRHIKDFVQLVFKVESNTEDVTGEGVEDSLSRQALALTCIGIGFSNFNRSIL